MRAATEGSLPPVMPQGNLVEVLGDEVRQGSPGELMVESNPSRQRRPPCKTNKEESDEAADAAALTYLLTYCALAGWRCSRWGWRKGVPGGVAFHHCEGRLRSGAPPPPTARPLGGLLGSATHVLRARACGCGGPSRSPWPACPVGAACRGGGGGPSSGGVACHRCEGRLVSGAVPPPAVCPLRRAAGLPRPVCPGCGRCGRGDPAPAPQRAPLQAGLARSGAGERGVPGGAGLPPL